MSFYVMKNSKYKDARGERIWFPSDERPYFDKALNKKFNTIQEKHAYMKEKGIIMDGSYDRPSRKTTPEAGDTKLDSRKVK